MRYPLLLTMVWSSIGLLFCVNTAFSQRLTQYEYWFDNVTDGRVAKNISVNATEVNIADSVNISSLKNGLHIISFRFRTTERWSTVNSNFFYKFTNNGQSITSYEYWFEEKTDARIIKSVSNPSDGIVLDSVNIASLSTGLHRFYIRFTGRNGWSSVAAYLFYKLPGTANQSISNYEYWFDDDTNNRTLKSIGEALANGILIDSVNTSTLKIGIHRFNIRFTGQSGWSSVATSLFYKFEGSKSDITGIEYWLNKDTQNRKFKKLTFRSDGVVLDSINIAELCRDTHTIHYRFRTTSGWSSVTVDTFFKIEPLNNQAVADFDFTTEGNLVAFSNNSTSGTRFSWLFGNGQSSNLKSPFYNYPNIGTYRVCLVAFNNGCPNDTLCKSVEIKGLSAITPNRGARDATVTIAIRGAGFRASTQVELVKSGQPTLVARSVLISSSNDLSSRFSLKDAALGQWTVRVKFADGQISELKDAFTVEPVVQGGTWVKIGSPPFFRSGVINPITVTIGNDGNTDLAMLPIELNGFPPGTQIKVLNPILPADELPIFAGLDIAADSIPPYYLDEAANHLFIPMLIPYLPAGSRTTIHMEITPASGINRQQVEIKAELGTPLIRDPFNFSSEEKSQLTECLSEVIKDVMGSFFGNECLEEINSFLFGGLIDGINLSLKKKKWQEVVSFTGDIILGLVKSSIVCARAQANVARKIGFIIDIYQKWQSVDKLFETCLPVGKKIGRDLVRIIIGNSFDPNIKVGPGQVSTAHFYGESTGPMTYRIYFENDTSAVLPAQRIIVTDTLDIEKLDINTFRFTHITIGSSIVNINNNGLQFIRDVSLPNLGVTARTEGRLDTITGIVQWVLTTIDPATNQFTTNPIAGILPPNNNPPEGDGHVGFVIQKRPNFLDSTIIVNKATITFDDNEPIRTDPWQVVTDDTFPISQLEPLIAQQPDTAFNLFWVGSDNFSGVMGYEIFVSQNRGNFQLWKRFDALTDSTRFQGWYGNTYAFYSIAIDSAGNRELPPLVPDAVTATPGTTNVNKIQKNNSWLGQNRPNPFSNTTEIDYYLDKSYNAIELLILDITGRVIKRVVRINLSQGQYTESINLNDLPAGVYSYKLNLDFETSFTKQMILIK